MIKQNDFIELLERNLSFEKSVDLFTGLGGVCLFYFYKAKIEKSVYLYNKGIEYIDIIFDKIEKDRYINYHYELPPIGFLIEYLNQNNLVDIDDIVVEDIDNYHLNQWQKIQINREGNFLFMYHLYYITYKVIKSKNREEREKNDFYHVLISILVKVINLANEILLSYRLKKNISFNQLEHDIELLFNLFLFSKYLRRHNFLPRVSKRLEEIIDSSEIRCYTKFKYQKLGNYHKMICIFLRYISITEKINLNKISLLKKNSICYYIKYFEKEHNSLIDYVNTSKYTKGVANVGLLNGLIAEFFLSDDVYLDNFKDLINLFFIYNSLNKNITL